MGWWWQGAVLIVLAGSLVAGCWGHGGTTSGGAFDVFFTDERLVRAGNGCAVRGNATNSANARARVELAYEALNASGMVIGTSTASFEVAAFSNFDFTSSAFTNSLSCSAVSSFRRTQTNVTAA